MKKLLTLSIALFTLTLTLVSLTNTAHAQATTGPSDISTPPPANASDVAKVYCNGQPITLTGPQDAGGVDFTGYQWFKILPDGTKPQVGTGKTYTETGTTTAGYYEYQLVTTNVNTCSSPASDVFKVYVLPPLVPTIASPISTLCTGVGTTTLTASATPASGYTINYQWTIGGVPITPAATGSTYAVPVGTTPGTLTYGVIASYALNPSCTATASKDIIIAPVPTKPVIAAN
jgi:hypothetical protein